MTVHQTVAIYPTDIIREQAKGRWLEILGYLAFDFLAPAIRRPGKHVTCPIHGSSRKKGDGFRLFKDVNETGGGICNQCGSYPDGFSMLMWLYRWNFVEAQKHVAEYLRIAPIDFKKRSAARVDASSPVLSTPPTTSNVVDVTPAQGVTENAEAKVLPFTPPTPERMAEIKAIQQRLAARVKQDSIQMQARIDRTWNEAISLDRGLPSPLYRYLKSRAILVRSEHFLKGDNLRFHAELPYYEEDDNDNVVLVGKFPALIAAVRNQEGSIITLHRTYLSPTGAKAKVESPRKMLSIPDDKTVTGSAIQLGGMPTDGVLGVAEGLETAISAMRVCGVPTWSCISATILEQFEPPAGVRTILIWADLDKSGRGQQAAQVLKSRLEGKGIVVHVMLPKLPIKGKGVDWNDVMVNEGIYGFPQWPVMRSLMFCNAKRAS